MPSAYDKQSVQNTTCSYHSLTQCTSSITKYAICLPRFPLRASRKSDKTTLSGDATMKSAASISEICHLNEKLIKNAYWLQWQNYTLMQCPVSIVNLSSTQAQSLYRFTHIWSRKKRIPFIGQKIRILFISVPSSEVFATMLPVARNLFVCSDINPTRGHISSTVFLFPSWNR